MKLAAHITISFSVSAVLYFIFRSNLLALSSFLFGIFIDLDHFFEYFSEYGFNVNVKRFFQAAENYSVKKTFLFLHSWEIFLVFSLIVFILPANNILFGIVVSYAFHLIFDQVGNLSRPLSYSLIYRWKEGFLTENIWRLNERRPG